jgi:hypothetical protein
MTDFHLSDALSERVLETTGAKQIENTRVIQALWKGHGHVLRLKLMSGAYTSVVLKLVNRMSDDCIQGEDAESLERKKRSYLIERNWYQMTQQDKSLNCRFPRFLASGSLAQTDWLLLDDLAQAGYSLQKRELNPTEISACVSWLAHFHVRFLGQAPHKLWPMGTYWHWATRQKEWQRMSDLPLKKAAYLIDQKLNQAHYQTWLHGDAKPANFCFSNQGSDVAAVDFQYIGGGCGMKDLAYFLSACLSEKECPERLPVYVDEYFKVFKQALESEHANIDFIALEKEWRALFPLAWTDFYRFLLGWMPTNTRAMPYSQKLAEKVVAQLGC